MTIKYHNYGKTKIVERDLSQENIEEWFYYTDKSLGPGCYIKELHILFEAKGRLCAGIHPPTTYVLNLKEVENYLNTNHSDKFVMDRKLY